MSEIESRTDPVRARSIRGVGGGGIVPRHEKDRKSDSLGETRHIDGAEPGDGDAAEDHRLQHRSGAQPADPAREILGRGLAVYWKCSDRHRFDQIMPFHGDADDGDGTRLSLLEGSVVDAEGVGTKRRGAALSPTLAGVSNCFRQGNGLPPGAPPPPPSPP